MKKIENAIESMANDALRTIIIAKKIINLEGMPIFLKYYLDDFETKDEKGVFKIETTDLTFLCLLGIKDILREEVPGAIKTCI